jgi:dihydroorotase-like cyclic amidohydrolase
MAFTLVAGLLSGCGGSSDPLTKAEFTQEASSICRDAKAEQAEALQAVDENAGLAELTSDALSPVQSMTEELSELSPPPADTQEVKALIEAFEAGVADVKASSADPAVSIAAFAEANQLAEAYGLADCVV